MGGTLFVFLKRVSISCTSGSSRTAPTSYIRQLPLLGFNCDNCIGGYKKKSAKSAKSVSKRNGERQTVNG
jgi:hypothetical protein